MPGCCRSGATVADRDLCRDAHHAFEEELLDRYTFRVETGGGPRYQLRGGRRWYPRESVLAVVRMCQGLGVEPTESPSVDMMVALYERLVKAEERVEALGYLQRMG